MIWKKFLLFASILLVCCESTKNQEIKTMIKPQDVHSFCVPEVARVTHLNWTAVLDFEKKTIEATASWDITKTEDADIIIFDTKGLHIKNITLDEGEPTEYRLADNDAILGQALAVMIRDETRKVNITYSTSPEAEALQWLNPQQTSGKKHPVLFTQSQAILARSWVPCQDSPGIRFTYDAHVTGPANLLILMSASNPQNKSGNGQYTYRMTQPIPSYLLALIAGDFSFTPISPRSGVYAEPTVLEKAAWEFADLEHMIAGAEDLYGQYQWERYDVIVLPPSFPFGGMENPRLTFATPTILAGDRSLTSLIAHELAHSWSGNLVTNATWNDFWLNEGFTVYFEHRIMEKLYGKDYSEMLASLALQELKETIRSLEKENLGEDTKLLLNLEGRNPDEGVTDIAYNKGYYFLRTIEEKYGRETFDRFLKDYFSDNSFSSMNTADFILYIKDYYRKQFNVKLPEQLFERWIFSPGLPDNCPIPNASRFALVDKVISTWKVDGKIDPNVTKRWSTHEWLHFLKSLPESLSQKQLDDLDKAGNFTNSGNSEILSHWFIHTIRNQYSPADRKLEEFLVNTGRRKFLLPLYQELMKVSPGKAREIYRRARANYHFVATNTFDNMLQ